MNQTIGPVTVGDGSTVYAGTFNSPVAQEQQNAQQALSFPEMYNRFHEIPDATSGTCFWILDNQTFMDWQDAQCGLLWIKGKPGVGKSTITKYLWNQFASENSSETQITASFFCHGRGVDLQRSPSGVFRALLHQIVQQVPSLRKDFEERYQARCKTQGNYGSAWNWTESELKNFTLDYLLKSCRDVQLLIFIDALDECGGDSARELLDFFKGVATVAEAQRGSRPKICVSSRHYPLVRTDILYEVVVDGENLADIRAYVAQRLYSFRESIRSYDELLSSIASRAGEIFQWCVLVVARVVRFLESRKPVELILQEIQETPQELFQLYRQVVRSYIENTNVNARDKKQFADLVQWVALAKRPLSVLELRSALWIDHSNQDISQSYEDLLGADIEHLSCGLAEVFVYTDSWNSHIGVGFIHQSVQEYFVSGGGLQDLQDSGSAPTARRTAELNVMRICYKSVLLSDVDACTQHPLLGYALENIFLHARSAEENQPVQNDLVQMLDFPKDDCVTNLAKFTYKYKGNLLHVAARFDIPNLISSVLDLAPEVSINIRDHQDQTALQIAAGSGSHNVIDRLLDISQTFLSKSMLYWWRRRLRVLQLNVRDSQGATPLMLAAQKGHSRIVEQLIQTQRAHLNAKDSESVTALHLAIENGHVDIAKALIHHGVNVRARDGKGRTPLLLSLHEALDSENEWKALKMLELFWSILTQSRPDLYLRDSREEPPPFFESLCSWIRRRQQRFSEIPGSGGTSPLERGLSSPRSLEFAQGLLDQGFDPHTPDRHGCVWFSYLYDASNPETLDLLQALPGANINFKDECGRTLLARLSSLPDSTGCLMIKALLKYPGVDVNARDKDGQTPLMLAAMARSDEVVKVLLADARSDPQATDKSNLCAYDYAITSKKRAQSSLTVELKSEFKDLHMSQWYARDVDKANNIIDSFQSSCALPSPSGHHKERKREASLPSAARPSSKLS
ncbi:hypothetical protein KCU95_g6263, partial [Aureobasidium melanogenum]